MGRYLLQRGKFSLLLPPEAPETVVGELALATPHDEAQSDVALHRRAADPKPVARRNDHADRPVDCIVQDGGKRASNECQLRRVVTVVQTLDGQCSAEAGGQVALRKLRQRVE